MDVSFRRKCVKIKLAIAVCSVLHHFTDAGPGMYACVLLCLVSTIPSLGNRKFRKNYVPYVKNSVAPLPLPELASCRCAVTAVP